MSQPKLEAVSSIQAWPRIPFPKKHGLSSSGFFSGKIGNTSNKENYFKIKS